MPDNTQNLHKKGLGLPHTIRLNSGQRMNQGRSQGCVSCFRHAVWQNSEAEHAWHRPESERGKSCEFSATSCGWCWSANGWRSAIWVQACSTASPSSAFRSASSRSKWPSSRSGRSAHRSTVCNNCFCSRSGAAHYHRALHRTFLYTTGISHTVI